MTYRMVSRYALSLFAVWSLDYSVRGECLEVDVGITRPWMKCFLPEGAIQAWKCKRLTIRDMTNPIAAMILGQVRDTWCCTAQHVPYMSMSASK